MLELNKIYNMDCLKGSKLLDDESVDLIVTSPPYNIGIDYGENYDDNKIKEDYFNFLNIIILEFKRIIKNDGVLALNVGNQRNSGLPHYVYFLLVKNGFNIIKEVFWYKGLYYIQGETIFICSLSGNYNNYYKRNDGYHSNDQFASVWEMRYQKRESKDFLKHDAFFVLMLPRKLIEITTKKGDTVLDPFMGSGTTAVACKQLQRNFIGFEINKKYCDIANERLSQQNLHSIMNYSTGSAA